MIAGLGRAPYTVKEVCRMDEDKTLDEIIAEFEQKHPEAKVMWEGWKKITADDIADYTGKNPA